MTEQRSSAWISPPGETIEDLLEERGWTKAELAERLGCTPKHVNELLKGRATINATMAAALSRVLGSTPEFWLEREARYRAALENKAAAAPLQSMSSWLKELPIAWMKKQKWIPDIEGGGDLVDACLRFFNVASVDAWRKVYLAPHAAYRSSPKFKKQPGAVAAWLRRAELEASELQCAPWNEKGFKALLSELRALTCESDPEAFVRRLQEACARHGVAVVFVPAPRGCPVCGATWWLSPSKAVLALSLRHKTNDHLWFAFFHEAGHLIRHSKKIEFVEGLDGLDMALEEEANLFASQQLIPPQFESELRTLRSHADVQEFAEHIGVHPGIVVGRLQFDKRIKWNQMNDLKQRYQWTDDE